MIEDRERLGRTFDLFEMPEPALDRLVRRRERKRRNQRIAAGVLAVALIAAGGAAFLGAMIPRQTAPHAPPEGETGTYTVKSFEPNLTFTVPPGPGWGLHEVFWSHTDLHIGGTERYARIWVANDPEVASRTCARERTPIATPGELVSWLTSHPALLAGDPVEVEVGGLAGSRVDLGVRPDRRRPCADGVPLLAVPAWSYPFHAWSLEPDARARLYALQLPPSEGGGVVTVVIARPDSEFAAALAEATAVVESFRFHLLEDQGGLT